MKEDFLNTLGELALASRLKRLSEKMLADVAQVYHHYDIAFQPKWFPLIALLDQKAQVGIVQAADLLGISQPAISQFCKQLDKQGLIIIKVSQHDSRMRQLSLSTKGKSEVEKMRPMWAALRKSASELCEEHKSDFFGSLIKLEASLNASSLTQRTLSHTEYGDKQ